MIRYHLRLMLILSGLLILPVLLIRAQPYDDSELRALLTADDCVAPCFLGIHPGATRVDEAIAILERHDWVRTIRNDLSGQQEGYIAVEWQPTHAPRSTPPLESQLYIVNGLVYNMDIQTAHSVWELVLLYGPPQATDSGVSMLGMVVFGYYFDRSTIMYTYVQPSCPVTQAKFWNSDLYVNFGNFRNAIGLSGINFACG